MRVISKLLVALTTLILGLVPLQAEATIWGLGNVNGSYGFRLLGLDKADTGSWIVATGVFVTDGKGGVSSGSITYNDGSDVCMASIESTKSSYTVATDGEGTLTITLTSLMGTCPITAFQFATALANPNNKPTPIAQTLEMNTTSVTIGTDQNSSNVMIYGVSNTL